MARRIAQADQRWGNSVTPAAVNFGNCFAYDVAKEHVCRLLFVGDVFSRTEIQRVV
ncbi:MAG: type II toxin-antitoxin system VapC family toxin [Acetobacteraceae bacterium]